MPLAHDLHLFAEPWEHVRMLSDGARNSAQLALLRRRAPGASVLEIGCGTGVWAVAAARLGARHVLAVEATPLAELARELAARNGLSDRVEIVEALLEDVEPRPMDLVFTELLNADPFAEGLLEVMPTAHAFRGPEGHVAPAHLRVYAQLVHAPASRDEARRAVGAVEGLGLSLGLDLAPLIDILGDPGPDRTLATEHHLLGPPTRLWDLALDGTEPEDLHLELPGHGRPDSPPPTGVVVWWEATLDEGIVMTNRPDNPGHWGQLVIGWTRELPVNRPVPVLARVDDDGLIVEVDSDSEGRDR